MEQVCEQTQPGRTLSKHNYTQLAEMITIRKDTTADKASDRTSSDDESEEVKQ